MNTFLKLIAFAGLVSALPQAAFAHERQAFKIGDKAYMFVIGSLNEPVFVDDKTGVDLRIQFADPKDPASSSSSELKPVEKLETSLQVEIAAGDTKQIFALEPAYKDPGAYRAPFFPTVETTYSYRVFGEMNGTPVDLMFSCNPAGHAKSEDDRGEAVLSSGVTRIFKAGAFGCPKARGAVQFPEKTGTGYEQAERIAGIARTSSTISWGAALLALIALGVAIFRKK